MVSIGELAEILCKQPRTQIDVKGICQAFSLPVCRKSRGTRRMRHLIRRRLWLFIRHTRHTNNVGMVPKGEDVVCGRHVRIWQSLLRDA